MRKLIAILVASAAMLFPAAANAHRPFADWQARQQVYNVYNWHCGNGDGWFCVDRQLQLHSAPVGDHSWAVYYAWSEATVWRPWDPRWCDVYVRVDGHTGGIVQIYQYETCHG